MNIKVSLFSNGIYIKEEIIDFLNNNSVNLILKCDTFDSNVFNKILGGKNAEKHKFAQKIYMTLEKLLEHGYSNNPKATNLAISIVPTKFNIDHIPNLVNFCIDNNIFPLIGELECAGKAKSLYSTLCPSNKQLIDLYNTLNNIFGEEYKIPICPSAVAGIHLNDIGDVIIHKHTGINCGWFDLKDPEMVSIGNIRTTSLKTLFEKIHDYRRTLYNKSNLRHWIKEHSSNESNLFFGGCGGKMLTQYFLKTMASIYETRGGDGE